MLLYTMDVGIQHTIVVYANEKRSIFGVLVWRQHQKQSIPENTRFVCCAVLCCTVCIKRCSYTHVLTDKNSIICTFTLAHRHTFQQLLRLHFQLYTTENVDVVFFSLFLYWFSVLLLNRCWYFEIYQVILLFFPRTLSLVTSRSFFAWPM